MSKTALVIGATGLTGRAILAELERSGEWDKVYAASRNRAQFETSATFVAVDMLDRDSCVEAFRPLTDVTHVFWAAYFDAPSFDDTREPNARIFQNAIPAIEAHGNLQHISICEGTKYYGQHLGPFKTPAKERDPRPNLQHYYYDWEDATMALQQEKSWGWSAARPHIICGFALGNPLNVMSIFATYGTMCRELGLPFTFPGKPGAFKSIYQATDVGILARAMIWMSTNEQCKNQVFNITNGDFYRYENMWPVLADYFGVENAGVEQVDLHEKMGGRDREWDAIVAKYGLMQNSYASLANWNTANYVFSNDWDVMSDTTKAKKYGFLEFRDTEEMFIDILNLYAEKKVIPRAR